MRTIENPIQATVNHTIDQIPQDQDAYIALKPGQEVQIIGLDKLFMVRVEGLSRKICIDRLDLPALPENEPALPENEQSNYQLLKELHEAREKLDNLLRRNIPVKKKVRMLTVSPSGFRPKTKKKNRSKNRDFIGVLSSNKKYSQRAQRAS